MDLYRSEAVVRELRAEMARQGRTKAALAQHLRTHRQTVQRRFNGNPHFTIDELDVVAEWLGVTLEDLIARSRSAA